MSTPRVSEQRLTAIIAAAHGGKATATAEELANLVAEVTQARAVLDRGDVDDVLSCMAGEGW